MNHQMLYQHVLIFYILLNHLVWARLDSRGFLSWHFKCQEKFKYMGMYMAESETQWTSLWADENESNLNWISLEIQWQEKELSAKLNKIHPVLCVLLSSDFCIFLLLNDTSFSPYHVCEGKNAYSSLFYFFVPHSPMIYSSNVSP